jgi:TPR repeat protein
MVIFSGGLSLPQDREKAMELWLQAGELGCTSAYHNIAVAHIEGLGVERDETIAKHYWELAAMGGDAFARHNLGISEENANNMNRAVKHWMISAGSGFDESLKPIRAGFLKGYVTKDEFEKALRAHQASKDELTSDQREAATAANSRRS